MSLSIAAYIQSGDLIEDIDVDDNADIAISKLATRTLYLSLPASLAAKSGTSVANTIVGLFGGVLMPDANTGILYWSVPLPDEYDSGTITLRIWWTTAATANNAKFSVALSSRAAGQDYSTTEETQTVTDAANGSASTLNVATVTFLAADFTAGDIIGIQLTRNPADAADTLGANLTIHAIDLEYTGRG